MLFWKMLEKFLNNIGFLKSWTFTQNHKQYNCPNIAFNTNNDNSIKKKNTNNDNK